MNIIDLRKKLLQSSTEQRINADRRGVPYQIGSPEWLEYLKNNQLKCPTINRRAMIRREADRNLSIADESSDAETTTRRIFLTAGEKKLLQDIYQTDFDDLDHEK